ncbi:polyphenol oxidase I, chloroplastic [Arachis hypogaea]|uniref:polyphenol oxidase I, chloroplastic n=1 Tax=Arachis hypogaea TaxID=3818 RepID=UPI000DEC0EB0|nr:polyphenol oxidase I, chloroplastic [Arachis hypogaea]
MANVINHPSRFLHLAISLIILIIFLIPLITFLNNNNSLIFTMITKPYFSYYLTSFNNQSHQSHYPWRFSWRNTFINSLEFEGNVNYPSSSSSSNYSNDVSRAISPDFTKCGPVDLPPNAITSPYCCPTLATPFKFIDFKDYLINATYNKYKNNSSIIRVRRPAHLVDDEFIAKLEKGIAIMKSLPNDDPRNFIQQAKVHCAYCNGGYPQKHPFQDQKIDVHRSWLFFPFHRFYIYFFERILGTLIGDPSFALPYWNWDSIQGMQIPSYFTTPNSSLYHKLRHYKHMPPHLVDLNYDILSPKIRTQDQQISYNLAFMYKQMVLANTKELFMGSPYRLGDPAQPGPGSVELAPHNSIHDWLGAVDTPNHEDMGTFYTAARDPIFYAHHSNVDRLWELWTKLEGGRRDYRDDPNWLDSKFFFYDENLNLVRVKVRDCLDTKLLGYVYEEVDLPWLNVNPKPRRTKMQREAKKSSILASKPITKFPFVLDSKVSISVKRPKKLRSKEEKEQEEEVLVIEVTELQSYENVKFDVHIDDDEDMLSDENHAEFVGTFVSLPHGNHGHKSNTRFMVGISKVLENLEAEEDDHIVVTLVPMIGKGDVTIGRINIQFMSK